MPPAAGQAPLQPQHPRRQALGPQRLAELDPSQPLACLCHHGMRSLQVANYLAQNGFAHVVNLQGGIDAWSHEVDPSVPRY
jgi:rhodanese-related sulfurtransferase